MKAVILAGGFGIRISEETNLKPKPMIEIGGRPILWHIMKIYSHYGINDFIICCGYKGYVIKEYFSNYYLYNSNVEVDLSKNELKVLNNFSEPWKVTLVNTGENTMTGGRLLRVKKYLEDEKFFCFTYGDGLANLNINNLIAGHLKSEKLATLTITKPQGRFGMVKFNSKDEVVEFREKPVGEDSWINSGFFVLSSKIFEYLNDDNTIWEKGPLEKLAVNRELNVWKHEGFWHPMDTLRDKLLLEKLWKEKKAPWNVWAD
ncbi:MAG: glucose-1-phosphate cytidylyltransferase [Candidatus Endolissoclinum sp. TMED37]|nr:MAG: glucose-1-phosphate cytidylyltransferase [Candidatus Endolissoclinum sp. TMED37]